MACSAAHFGTRKGVTSVFQSATPRVLRGVQPRLSPCALFIAWDDLRDRAPCAGRAASGLTPHRFQMHTFSIIRERIHGLAFSNSPRRRRRRRPGHGDLSPLLDLPQSVPPRDRSVRSLRSTLGLRSIARACALCIDPGRAKAVKLDWRKQ